MKITFLILFFLSLCICVLKARPQFSALSGNRCINCHVTAQGGGPRYILGAYARSDVSLLNLSNSSLGDFFEFLAENNSILDDKIQLGLDYRFLTARLGSPDNSEREYFTMQATPYLTMYPFEWLTLQGQFNFAETGYPGQESWSANMIIHPSYDLPRLRVGYFMPSIGVRHDDHTILVRQSMDAGLRPIIAPDYAEFGAELSYYGLKFMSASAGVFGSENLSEHGLFDRAGNPVPLVPEDKLSALIRLAFQPRFFENKVNTNFGASYFFNDDFSLINIFAMAGWTDHATVIAEYSISEKHDLRKTNNFMIEALYRFLPSLMLSARYEKADTEYSTNVENPVEYIAKQIVFGAYIYPLPYIELRPEYRIFDREAAVSYQSQWALQLHLYY